MLGSFKSSQTTAIWWNYTNNNYFSISTAMEEDLLKGFESPCISHDCKKHLHEYTYEQWTIVYSISTLFGRTEHILRQTTPSSSFVKIRRH